MWHIKNELVKYLAYMEEILDNNTQNNTESSSSSRLRRGGDIVSYLPVK